MGVIPALLGTLAVSAMAAADAPAVPEPIPDPAAAYPGNYQVLFEDAHGILIELKQAEGRAPRQGVVP